MVLAEEYFELEKRCKFLEKQLEHRNEELKGAEQERRVLGELATVNSLTVRKFELDRDYNRSVLPEDSLDKICRLENMLKLEKQRADQAQKQQRQQAVALAKQDKEIERLSAELDMVKKETGWAKSSSRGSARATPQPDAINRIGELQLLNARLEEEQKTSKQIQRKKTQLIDSLSKELDQKRKSEEDLCQAQNIIKVKDKEIRELQEELRTLQRIQAKKDKVICGLETGKDETAVRILEGDKRFLQAEIAKHQEIRRQQEKSMKAQQFRIDQLEARLDAISVALKDLKLEKQVAELVRTQSTQASARPAGGLTQKGSAPLDGVYDLQLRHVDSLRNALTVKEALLAEKDTNVEALEKKVHQLSQSKVSSSTFQVERKYRAEVDDLRKALDTQTTALRMQIEKLRQENSQLKEGGA